MEFDFEALPVPERYKLLTASVTPRPIAWITSQDAQGRVNAAPFSFFNAFSADPPILGIGIGNREQDPARGEAKDTKANIRATGGFVVNLVDFASAPAMNRTATAFPPGHGEIEEAGLAVLPSLRVAPPRIASSPVSYECRLHMEIPLGPNSTLLLGRVLLMHVRDALVQDAGRHHLAPEMQIVGRMGGAGGYCRTGDQFTIDRISLESWQQGERG